jgi:osmotically-inducible protein OsmY
MHAQGLHIADFDRVAFPPWKPTDNPGLTAKVESALSRTGYTSLRNLRVSARHSAVVLRGDVPTYHLKQVAQAAALAVPEVRELRNELTVVRAS